jgi:hypothetical protein
MVMAILDKHRISYEAPSAIAVVPIVVLGFHLAQLLDELVRCRRDWRPFIVDNTLLIEEKLDAWNNGEDFLSEEDQDGWAFNWGVAGGQLENLRHIPASALALVRRCGYPRCSGYLRRSGMLNPRFCSQKCRRAAADE